jgi:hypothetical protein
MCFMKTSCTHTTTREAYVFPDDRLARMHFANDYDTNTLRIASFCTAFRGQTKRVLRARVCSASTSHLWVPDNPPAIRDHEYQVRFSVSVWAGIVGDIVLGPCLLPDRLTVQ